ncbi:MAG: sulfatase-like hydrolase/transferase, partial [Cyclobacteriaceae bacterium]|nr:sulfatase-like hydrolase/transferase [Cyclobacteriaceae bacterium]
MEKTVLALLILISLISCEKTERTEKNENITNTANTNPNIVLILVDDMGYGDLSSYNADSKIPTPHLDKLAEQGMRFTDAHSAGSLCHPSRYGLLTGQLPFRIDYSVWREHALIAENQMTIASLLKEEGYRTAMVGKWHLGFDENGYENPLPGGPVDRG